MPEMTLVEAVNLALARAMEEDPNVVVLGEDVGVNGGVFRATVGLQQRFGAERVIDTPLAELLISGLCVGMAVQGLRPVGEIQFMGFAYPCIDQLVNHASRMRNRTQGRLSCPMVLRTPYGAGIRAPEHHSESTEAMLAHIPGLRVVTPSSPERAYGLLLAAIRDPDPVVFLEPTRIYRAAKGSVEDNGEALPLDIAFVLREGRDVTLITWGAMVKETSAAADELAADGIDAEVIDLATLKPYDEETVLDHALTRPWTVAKRYRRESAAQPYWREVSCTENNNHVEIGKQDYMLGPDGRLMPTRKDQPPPDLKYFKPAAR